MNASPWLSTFNLRSSTQEANTGDKSPLYNLFILDFRKPKSKTQVIEVFFTLVEKHSIQNHLHLWD